MPTSSRRPVAPASRATPDPGEALALLAAKLRDALAADEVSVIADLPRGTVVLASAGARASQPDHPATETLRRRFQYGAILAHGQGIRARARRPEARTLIEELSMLATPHALEARLALAERLRDAASRIAAICQLDLPLPELMAQVADIVRETFDAGLASAFCSPVTPGSILGRIAPERFMAVGPWAALVTALQDERSIAMFTRLEAKPYERADLDDGATRNPVEAWLRHHGLRSLTLVRAQSGSDGNSVTLSIAMREPGRLSADEVRFLRDTASVVQLASERIRAQAVVVELRERSAAQGRLLDSIDQPQPLALVSATFARELAVRFNVECLAITALGEDESVIWRSPALADSALNRMLTADHPPRSTAAAAIRDGGEVVGRAWVAGMGGRPPAATIEQIEAVLGHLAALMRHTRALRRLESDRRVSRATATLLSSLNPQSEIHDVANIFAQQAKSLLGATGVMVATFDNATPRIEALASDALQIEDIQRAVTPDGRPLLDALQDLPLMPTRFDDVSLSEGPIARMAAGFGVRSLMRATIPDADGAVRGMVVAASDRPDAWDQGQQAILIDFAAALGLVLERTRVTSTLERLRNRRDAVLALISALGPRDSVEEVANPVCAALRGMYGVEHCSLAVFENGRALIRGLDSDAFASVAELEAAVGTDSYIERFAERRFDLIPDVAAYATDEPVLARLAEHGVRSMLRVLVGSPEAPAGVLSVASSTPNSLSERDALELGEIARPMALLIGYFRRRQESVRRADRLEATNRALQVLAESGPPAELSAAFLNAITGTFSAEASAVVVYESGRAPRTLASTGFANSGDALAALANAPNADLPCAYEPLPPERAQGFGQVLAAPFATSSGDGVVALWRRTPAPETAAEDCELLASLAGFLSVSIARAVALRSLAESELRYRSVVSQAEEMILLYDSATWQILDANPYALRILGRSIEQIRQLRIDQLSTDDRATLARHVQRAIADGEVHTSDRPYVRSDGTIVTMDIVASPIGFEGRQAILVLGRDSSERQLLQRRLIQGQKMEALGSMAGNIAHDFNNLLTTVLGFAGLLRRDPAMNTQSREYLGLIEDAARRAADLSQQMLSFARGGLVRFGPVNVGETIGQTLRLAQAGLPASITVKTYLSRRPVMVEGDQGQLQQALLNIINNARDAMPTGGTLTIRLRAAGDGCILSIADTGTGMDDETRMRLFEPFFTTKPPGVGTGLGMSIVYGIIQGHHGSVSVTSAPGKGTTFTLHLPLLELAPAPELPPPPESTAGQHVVLVVDDDNLVRRTLAAMLAELGYHTATAANGPEALELVREAPERFAVVMLDLVMPGMSGAAVFHEIERIRPNLPIVVCTGYADDDHIDADVQRRAAAILHKPFTPDRLSRSLQLAGAFPERRTP